MLVNDNSGGPQVHCEAGKGQLVCSTGLRKEREGAPPAVGLRGAL